MEKNYMELYGIVDEGISDLTVSERCNNITAIISPEELHARFAEKMKATYIDHITKEFCENGFPMTESIASNISKLYKTTGKEYMLRDLADRSIDFGPGQEFADNIFSECKSIEEQSVLDCAEMIELEA